MFELLEQPSESALQVDDGRGKGKRKMSDAGDAIADAPYAFPLSGNDASAGTDGSGSTWNDL